MNNEDIRKEIETFVTKQSTRLLEVNKEIHKETAELHEKVCDDQGAVCAINFQNLIHLVINDYLTKLAKIDEIVDSTIAKILGEHKEEGT